METSHTHVFGSNYNMALSVSVCLRLGQSLRDGDAESFLDQYDNLLKGLNHPDAGLQVLTCAKFHHN